MRSFFFCLIVTCGLVEGQDDFLHGTFPSDFQWGFATAAYQIEGAYNKDGKGLSIWDTWTHLSPSPIVDGSTGDVACDSYHKYAEDVALLKATGAHYYRFSLSWSRLLPLGTIQQINPLGVDYYNKLIDLLIANGIEPMITLFHWDFPEALMSLGNKTGWPEEEVIPHFVDYADFAFKTFGDRVKKWITFNEPWVFCYQGYGDGGKAPAILEPTYPYKCAHNVLRSHAKAYHVYNNTYKATQGGIVGITLDSAWYEPADPNDESSVSAAERAIQFKHGWFGAPVFFGDYPAVMREYVDLASNNEGIPSRLPKFTEEESRELIGSSDFLGLNHYTTELCRAQASPTAGWNGDQDVHTWQDPSWPASSASWLKTVPWGFRKLLNWLKKTYGDVDIYVTESGFADFPDTGINDTGRVDYYTRYINEMLKAVTLDGVNVKSYTAWSLLDNFEWQRGYTERFGVHHVDFSNPQRPRTPKASAGLLTQIFKDNGFPAPASPGKSSSFAASTSLTVVFLISTFFLNNAFHF